MLKISNQAHYHKQAARQLLAQLDGYEPETDLLLQIDDDSIAICTQIQHQKACFEHSFTSTRLRQRAQQKKQALLKACNSKKNDIHNVTDLTAGWGKDSFILASHGQQVTMVEQQPLIHGCVNFLLSIAAKETQDPVFDRLEIHHRQGLEYLQGLAPAQYPDCIYLDPMFPAHKSTARPGKDLQILQLLTDNSDMQATFEAALQSATKRVVVKRPVHAPTLDARTPDIVYREKTIRFDVYLA